MRPFVLFLVLPAAACLGLHGAFAQEPGAGGGLGFGSEPIPPADFVVRSRPDPASIDYTPLTPPERGANVKTSAEIEAMQADLDAALARNRRAAARVKIPDVAAPAAPKKRKGGRSGD